MSQFGIVDPNQTMYQMVAKAAMAHPEKMAYSFLGKQTTYRRMLQRIDAAAAGLLQLGIGKGDRVTVCMPNMPQAVDCIYALNRIGAVANVIHPLCAEQELAFYLQLSQSKAILTLDQFYDKVSSVAECMVLVATVKEELPFVKKLLYCNRKTTGGIPWRSLYATRAGRNAPQGDSGACACILYSGGTTGKPKGVCLTNDNFNAAALQTLKASGYQDFAGMKMLSVLPIFHGFGLGVGIHTPLIAGAGCILLPRFRLGEYIRILKRERPDFIPGVPTLFEAMLQAKGLETVKLDFLKGIFCGGDTLTGELKARVDAFLQAHGCTEQIREGYGMTECVSVACLTPRRGAKPGSIGLPFEAMDFQITDPQTNTPLPVGQEGEICISGPSVMTGYLDDPEETAQALRRHADGKIWLHTGDLGTMDADGYVRFTQRLKRLIITNGYNVHPARLEQILCSHGQVRSACVIGIPDPYRGQKVVAFVVCDAEPSEELKQSVLDHCARHIARYAMPRQLEFREKLPKTPLGKIDYRALQEEL